MPNPNRPQYQDTIEETWGQAVADTVVRRYTSTADRDADLAGIAPAALAGQVVVVQPAGGPPLLQTHDGVAWRTQLGVSAFSGVVTTDQWGNWTLTNQIPAGGHEIGSTAVGAQTSAKSVQVRNTTDMAAGGTFVMFLSLWADSGGTMPNSTIGVNAVIVWSN